MTMQIHSSIRIHTAALCLLAALSTLVTLPAMASYSNVTLESLGGDLTVVVYLPHGIYSDERAYYYSSRFDHGSMVGSILRKTRDGKTHELYGTDMWRTPHNTNWPESGVGLASEFGVGDDGSFCNYRCGWGSANDITNGVLGYQEAKNGESFLKIGVGELVKGTCPTCDSSEDYKFNSPYMFAKTPDWKMTAATDNSVTLEHKATLHENGYKLKKEMALVGEILTVTSTLTNLGSQPFSTAWYSHNFFTCDSIPLGPGYSVDLNLKGARDDIYDEPSTWSWSTPLQDYAKVDATNPNAVHVEMKRALESGTRIKAEFADDGYTNGEFKINACGVSIESSIPQVESGAMPMYAYNLYIERGTLSPEPQILIHLEPGKSSTWTQHLVITDISTAVSDSTSEKGASAIAGLGSIAAFDVTASRISQQQLLPMSVLLASTTLLILVIRRSWAGNRQHLYTSIPDGQP
jgi:hypothetical protein